MSFPTSKYRRGRVQGNKGDICPTITCNMENVYLYESEEEEPEPQVLTAKRTEYGKAIRKQYESGEIKESRHNMTTLEPRTDGISNTLTSVLKDNLICEPLTCAMRGRGKGKTTQQIEVGEDISNCLTSVQKDSMIMESYPLNSMPDGTCRTIKRQYQFTSQANLSRPTGGYAATGVITYLDDMENRNFRIRKLTPRECFRLMGVEEKNIDKIQAAGISNSQQYKMAGNSIVVDVMEKIFTNLFYPGEEEKQEPTLF